MGRLRTLGTIRPNTPKRAQRLRPNYCRRNCGYTDSIPTTKGQKVATKLLPPQLSNTVDTISTTKVKRQPMPRERREKPLREREWLLWWSSEEVCSRFRWGLLCAFTDITLHLLRGYSAFSLRVTLRLLWCCGIRFERLRRLQIFRATCRALRVAQQSLLWSR